MAPVKEQKIEPFVFKEPELTPPFYALNPFNKLEVARIIYAKGLKFIGSSVHFSKVRFGTGKSRNRKRTKN
jgi:hypothetical protein